MDDGEIPFLWPCFSSWEYHPPSLPPQDHAETPATAVSEHQEKRDWSQENGEHCSAFGGSVQSWRLGWQGKSEDLPKIMIFGRQRLKMPEGPREPGEVSEQEWDMPGQKSLGTGSSPTWQSIMASSSFSSIFFSPVSAHRRASRTGPSGRPPSFFRGASQSGDKAMGRRGQVGSCPWRIPQTAQVREPCALRERRGFPILNQQQI